MSAPEKAKPTSNIPGAQFYFPNSDKKLGYGSSLATGFLSGHIDLLLRSGVPISDLLSQLERESVVMSYQYVGADGKSLTEEGKVLDLGKMKEVQVKLLRLL